MGCRNLSLRLNPGFGLKRHPSRASLKINRTQEKMLTLSFGD